MWKNGKKFLSVQEGWFSFLQRLGYRHSSISYWSMKVQHSSAFFFRRLDYRLLSLSYCRMELQGGSLSLRRGSWYEHFSHSYFSIQWQLSTVGWCNNHSQYHYCWRLHSGHKIWYYFTGHSEHRGLSVQRTCVGVAVGSREGAGHDSRGEQKAWWGYISNTEQTLKCSPICDECLEQIHKLQKGHNTLQLCESYVYHLILLAKFTQQKRWIKYHNLPTAIFTQSAQPPLPFHTHYGWKQRSSHPSLVCLVPLMANTRAASSVSSGFPSIILHNQSASTQKHLHTAEEAHSTFVMRSDMYRSMTSVTVG